LAGRVLQIAGVGKDAEPILVGAKAFPVTKIILLYEERDAQAAVDLVTKLAPHKCEIDRRLIGQPTLTQVLAAFASIVHGEALQFDDVLVNVTVADKMLSCSLMSGAFIHGLRAFAVQKDGPIQLPVLKFAYREMISESKMNILRALERAGGEVDSLNDLSEMSGVEKSLLSYHIRGGRDAKGLEELNLVSIERAKQGRLMVKLTEMGRLILLGSEPVKAAPAAHA
jgi:DNA-binding transcriptional ArsR family regulator